MNSREVNVLILGEVPEVGDIFGRPIFRERLPAAPIHVRDHGEYSAALAREDTYSLVLIDVRPHGLEVLEQVRESRPACPVIMIADQSEANLLLEAKREGLEAYLMRGIDDALFTDLLAEEIYTLLKRFIEPPTMESPSADEMYRYAQFFNVLEPFYVVACRRYLLYINKAGQKLVDAIHGREPQAGDPVEKLVLEDSLDEFESHMNRAFAGHELVRERTFEALTNDVDDGRRELHYRPVITPKGRVVAVSISIHQPAHPELQRARTMQQLAYLAAGISHENNNLLNVLMSNADLLADRLKTLGDREATRHLETIERAIERSTHFVHQLQAFSRTGVSQPEAFNLSELIADMLDSPNAGVPDHIALSPDLEPNLPDIWADRRHWETVVTNLVKSAVQELREGRRIGIKTRSVQVTPRQRPVPVMPGNYVALEVVHDGDAREDWMLNLRFDPFFAMRRMEGHAGLEMVTVKSVIEQGGGQIEVESTDDQTTVRVYYPVADSAKDHQEPRDQEPPRPLPEDEGGDIK